MNSFYKISHAIYLREGYHLVGDQIYWLPLLYCFRSLFVLKFYDVFWLLNISDVYLSVLDEISGDCLPFLDLGQLFERPLLGLQLFLTIGLIGHHQKDHEASHHHKKVLHSSLGVSWNPSSIHRQAKAFAGVWHNTFLNFDLDVVDIIDGLEGRVEMHVLFFGVGFLREYSVVSEIFLCLAAVSWVLLGVRPHRFTLLRSVKILRLNETFFHFDGLEGLLDDDEVFLSLLTVNKGLLVSCFCRDGTSWPTCKRLSLFMGRECSSPHPGCSRDQRAKKRWTLFCVLDNIAKRDLTSA